MYKFPDEAVIWALGKLTGLASKSGYPDLELTLLAHAKALLRIAHPLLVKRRIDSAREGVKCVFLESDLAAGGSQLESVEVIRRRRSAADDNVFEDFGAPVNPTVWLVETAIDTFKYYPQPIELREVFRAAKFPVADGEDYNLLVDPAREPKTEAAGTPE